MNDEVAFFEFGEVNVERGAGRQRVRRFEPARPLDFVTPEDFRVRDDDEAGSVRNEAASERAKVSTDGGRSRPTAEHRTAAPPTGLLPLA